MPLPTPIFLILFPLLLWQEHLVTVNNEDLITRILGGLDKDYKNLCSTIQVCKNPITFDELHEKLNNFEAYLKYEA